MATVWHKEMALIATDGALESLGLRDGQQITAAQVWQVITANAAALAADMHMHNILHPHNKVDAGPLDETLARVGRRRHT